MRTLSFVVGCLVLVGAPLRAHAQECPPGYPDYCGGDYCCRSGDTCCGDGWCCPGGQACLGGGRCGDGGSAGGTCPSSHPVTCEAIGKCCPEGTTCGEEGCCRDLSVQGCTSARRCSDDAFGYYVVDGARYDCESDECEATRRSVAEHCHANLQDAGDDGGCSVGPPGASEGSDGSASPLMLGIPALLAAATAIARRRALRRAASRRPA